MSHWDEKENIYKFGLKRQIYELNKDLDYEKLKDKSIEELEAILKEETDAK